MTTRSWGVLILTHGRPDRVHTLGALHRAGYTGPVRLVIDSEDKTGPEYRERYGDQVIVFDKADVWDQTDTIDQDRSHRGVVFARNAAWGIAEELGWTHFVVLDDDYSGFEYKVLDTRPNGDPYLRAPRIRSLDWVLTACLDLLDTTGAAAVAFAQGGDYVGGANNYAKIPLRRKAMNLFVFRTDRPYTFTGRINEDVNLYVGEGKRGHLFFTDLSLSLVQGATQQNAGGLTELYLDTGTYVKSFLTVIANPSCVRVAMLRSKYQRLHHEVRSRYAYPHIIRETYRKGRRERET